MLAKTETEKMASRTRQDDNRQKRPRAYKKPIDTRGYTVALKLDPSGIERKSSLHTYGNLVKETNAFIDRLKRVTTDLSLQTIKNVVSYTRQLVKPGTEVLDENIFMAQMSKFFKITETYLLKRIYEVLRNRKTNCGILNFSKLICIFISDDMKPKIDYAFRVYDVRSSGCLNTDDLETALRPLIQYTHTSGNGVEVSNSAIDLTHEDTERKTLKEIVNLLLSMIDTNKDKTIDLEEFHTIVARYPLMLECLGPCLPEKKYRDSFIKLVQDKSSFEVSAYFRHERKVSLNDPTPDTNIYDKLYPFQLEFP